MSSHYEWGSANGALYAVWGENDLDSAQAVLCPDEGLEGPCVLFLGNEAGDGLVLEGEAEDIARYCLLVLDHVNVRLRDSLIVDTNDDLT
jgi:hypothetical protein